MTSSPTVATRASPSPTRRMSASGNDLGDAIHHLVAGRIDIEAFARRFVVSRMFTLSPVRSGPFVMSRPGGEAVVPVWSTSRGLLRVMGGYCWLVSTGEDLVDQLPAGVGVLIDDGLPCPVALPSSLLASTLLVGNRCRSS